MKLICDTTKTRVSESLFNPVSCAEGVAISYKTWKQCTILHEDISNKLSLVDIDLSMALQRERIKNEPK